MSQVDDAASERLRLARLREFELLDSGSEPAYDAMTRLAASICGTPISLVSLIDESRQWFKSNFGLDGVTETPRDVAFCARAIEQRDIFEVPDATLDPRFRDNPLVKNDPAIRFYAGVPLVVDGTHALGTLCVIDRVARVLDEHQREQLQLLATALVELIESRIRVPGKAQERLDFLSTALDRSNDFILLARMRTAGDPETRIGYANESFARETGYSRAQLASMGLLDIVDPETDEAMRARMRAGLAGGREAAGEVRARRADGSRFWLELSARPILDADAGPVTYIVVGRNVDQRKRQAEAVARAGAFIESVVNSAPDPIFVKDRDHRFVLVNDACCEFLGYPREAFIGKTGADIFPPDRAELYRSKAEAVFASGDVDVSEESYEDPHGETFHIEAKRSLVRSADGDPLLVGVIRNITRLKSLQSDLERQAHVDFLTGVATRRHILHLAEAALESASRAGAPLSLLLFDIDRFKTVNDVHGHDAGDTVLRNIGIIARATMRQMDVIGRLGGEEFVVLLPNCDARSATAAAERLRLWLANAPIALADGGSINVTASIGVASACANDSVGAMLARADRALYDAKGGGRNAVCVS